MTKREVWIVDESLARRREDREREWRSCPVCGSRIEIEVTDRRPSLRLVDSPVYGYLGLEVRCPNGCFP